MLKLLRDWARSVPLYLCSNTNPLHWRHVVAMEPELLQPFLGFFLSFEMRIRKPDPQYFHRVLAEIGAEPRECLFIDDMEKNLDSARGIGLRTILFESVDSLRGRAGFAASNPEN